MTSSFCSSKTQIVFLSYAQILFEIEFAHACSRWIPIILILINQDKSHSIVINPQPLVINQIKMFVCQSFFNRRVLAVRGYTLSSDAGFYLIYSKLSGGFFSTSLLALFLIQ